MRVQWATIGRGLLGRGLYKLPVKGPQDEIVMCAVMSDHRTTQSGILLLPWGSSLDRLTEELADELEKADPMSDQVRRRLLKVG